MPPKRTSSSYIVPEESLTSAEKKVVNSSPKHPALVKSEQKKQR